MNNNDKENTMTLTDARRIAANLIDRRVYTSREMALEAWDTIEAALFTADAKEGDLALMGALLEEAAR